MTPARKGSRGHSGSLEAQRARLVEARRDPSSPETLSFLRQALAGAGSYLAAGAARLAGEFEIRAVAADLVSAFSRFLADPLRSDPGCHAKLAIAEALRQIGAPEGESAFLEGLHYVQMEPVYGGREDAAVSLRGACGLALAQSGHPRAVLEITELLADREAPARMAAARALGDTGRPEAVPLLRFKTLVGDEDARVLGECFSALLHLTPETSLDFVAGYLKDARETVAEAAAVSLGDSRLSGALPLLAKWWSEPPPAALRSSCLLALALLRSEEGLGLLLDAVRSAHERDARAAIDALATYRGNPLVARRALEAAESRGSEELRAAVRKAFSEEGG